MPLKRALFFKQCLSGSCLFPGGADITPAADIRGFEIQGTGSGIIFSAARLDSDTIRLDISDDTSSITGITYLYGSNPGDQDLHSFVAGYVHDNSSLELPLEGADIQEIQ